ncbi:UNVERIFIED_CONTAM: hypothetical protein PYX00_009792 [Menopon gallinae]
MDAKTGEVYAGKVVPKRLLRKGKQKEKMTSEINIHQQLKHHNVVAFYNFFDDDTNVYIVLELCRKRSMMELHRRRKTITEPEARYFMKQILEGVGYLHKNNIIHRDLKLGNLFLDHNLTVKIGDFGLAAKLEFSGERKKTLCGTPNYIAPEILNNSGHSFEVDLWSIGCILYALLVGKPPFETHSLDETYSRIQECKYTIPSHIAKLAQLLITWLLQIDPKKRPKIDETAQHEWFSGFTPNSLPTSVLISAPRFNNAEEEKIMKNLVRKPLKEVNNEQNTTPSSNTHKLVRMSVVIAGASNSAMVTQYECRNHLEMLVQQLDGLVTKNVKIKKLTGKEEDTDPAAQPLIWVSKWVDYSDKYGFGFQLIDGSWGVLFNDTTKIVVLANEMNVHYIHRDGVEEYFTISNYPAGLEKKIKLLSYFRRYMKENLMTAGSDVPRVLDSVSRTPYLYQWFRTSKGVFMCLTNGTVQVNFSDHTKIILCPLMGAVTYVDEEKAFRTYRFSTIQEHGTCKPLMDALKYAHQKLNYNMKAVLPQHANN